MALLGMTTIYTSTESGSWPTICRNSPMIWWPFNFFFLVLGDKNEVVTHQWSCDLSISPIGVVNDFSIVVTHQWSGDLSIVWAWSCLRRWLVVTHQWSGDLSMWVPNKILRQFKVVTHQWSCDLSMELTDSGGQKKWS